MSLMYIKADRCGTQNQTLILGKASLQVRKNLRHVCGFRTVSLCVCGWVWVCVCACVCACVHCNSSEEASDSFELNSLWVDLGQVVHLFTQIAESMRWLERRLVILVTLHLAFWHENKIRYTRFSFWGTPRSFHNAWDPLLDYVKLSNAINLDSELQLALWSGKPMK